MQAPNRAALHVTPARQLTRPRSLTQYPILKYATTSTAMVEATAASQKTRMSYMPSSGSVSTKPCWTLEELAEVFMMASLLFEAPKLTRPRSSSCQTKTNLSTSTGALLCLVLSPTPGTQASTGTFGVRKEKENDARRQENEQR